VSEPSAVPEPSQEDSTWKPNLRAGAMRIVLEDIWRHTSCGWAKSRAGEALRKDKERMQRDRRIEDEVI